MSATQDLQTAFDKLDSVDLTPGESAAVAHYLKATLSEDAEVSGFREEPKARGFLLEVSGLMKTDLSFGASWQPNFKGDIDTNFTATDDLAR